MKVLSYSWSKFFSKVSLPRCGIEFLQLCRELAKKKGFFLYIAGGPVRDLLLNRPIKDLDVVLEGDWESLFEQNIKKIPGKVLFKTTFYTYKIELSENLVLDLVTARRETYPEPASLPIVEKATFKEDIMRRDFTINALIYGLTPPFEERIVDLVSGLKDLKERKITPLHLDSFIEDPTRVLRGIRFKVRFQFCYDTIFYEALKRAQASSA
ncbi:MAG: polya polymerase, partial [Caldimicrobium sp.]